VSCPDQLHLPLGHLVLSLREIRMVFHLLGLLPEIGADLLPGLEEFGFHGQIGVARLELLDDGLGLFRSGPHDPGVVAGVVLGANRGTRILSAVGCEASLRMHP